MSLISGGSANMATTAALRRQLAATERRVAASRDKLHRIKESLTLDLFKMELLAGMLEAGPGHAWTEPRYPEYPGDTAASKPQCRHCGGWLPYVPADPILRKSLEDMNRINKVAPNPSRKPCPGDVHRCPTLLPGPDNWPEAQQQWGDPDGMWRCNRGGAFDDESFTSWTCAAGHVASVATHRGKKCNGIGCPHEFFIRPASTVGVRP